MKSEILNEVEKLIQEKTQQARQMILDGCENNGPINAIANLLLVTMLSEKEATQSVNEWVPCSERLPEEEVTVLVTNEDGIVYVDCLVDGVWMVWRDNVVAWMPLPEPYTVKT